MKLGWNVHLMKSYLPMIFFNNGIQVLEQRWKKCVDHKVDCVKNKPHMVTFNESILVCRWSDHGSRVESLIGLVWFSLVRVWFGFGFGLGFVWLGLVWIKHCKLSNSKLSRLSIIWKSDLTDKMKRSFFQAAVVSILLYGCTTWTRTKLLEKKLDGNYTRMLRAILNKSWRQHPTRHQLYCHLPTITKTIQVRRTRYAGHCWRSKDDPIRDVLLWTPAYVRAKAGWPARTYIQQLCEDTGCSSEDLPEAMNDREKWRERVRDIRASGMTWWWWWNIYDLVGFGFMAYQPLYVIECQILFMHIY